MYAINDQEINKTNFNWESEIFDDLTLKFPAYRTVSFEPSFQGDSLIGQDIIFPGLCEILPENEIFYLLFQKTSQGTEKYGWLKLKIDGNEKCYSELKEFVKPTN